ncbi:hypothetical protein B0I35DRAFT_109645 [Stachybotrys elegans]|uniref:NAD-dependent epimerase/dehydratase domain-containing protein n=1 Tax=Stachybotrys elegans TaxID=80388 RepID=A0A8K0SEF8_9HYPO|nr:hypothetical protein B0I35DRAFT_109645 [Stachybotrys elegans]
MVKILLVGGTGQIGRYVLDQCLAHPDIHDIVVFVRRELPSELRQNSKIHTVLMTDFLNWSDEILSPHKDAVAMIWAIGDQEGRQEINVDYPLACQKALIAMRSSMAAHERTFRYIHLSGKLTIQSQSRHLCLYEKPRKAKGLHELRALEMAHGYPWWKLYIIRPGLVVDSDGLGALLARNIMGSSWAVRGTELGDCMAYLALGTVHSSESIVMNEDIVKLATSHHAQKSPGTGRA